MKTTLFLTVIASSALLLSACSSQQQDIANTTTTTQAPTTEVVSPEAGNQVSGQANGLVGGQAGAQGDSQDAMVPGQAAGAFVDYSETAVTEATQNGGKAVLFFHASWCPTCKAAERDITSNLDQIPSDLTIIKTDYDSMDELKRQYGVTYQHTFVQVDAEGNEVTKWNGGALDQIVSQVQ